MRDASLVACTAQAILAAYLGLTLRLGARTHARKALGRVLLALAVNHALLALSPLCPTRFWLLLLNDVCLAPAVVALAELAGVASWLARGGHEDESTVRPRVAFLAGAISLGALVVAGVGARLSGWLGNENHLVMLGACLLFEFLAVAGCAIAWRRGVAGGRAFALACLWPIVVPVIALLGAGPADVAVDLFRTIRDLAMMAFELALLRAYLDDGHEPMSVRTRIVSLVLGLVLAFAVASAHLILPREIAPGASFFVAHAPAFRMLVAVAIAAALVIGFAPGFFRESLLGPLDSLSKGLARVEAGEHPKLPAERKDELGQVARSFNAMVRRLAEGRAALAEKITELESHRRDIEALNEELSRQIVARSRQLADALKTVDREARPIQTGVVLDDRYVVLERLGAGAMGLVFAARRQSDDRPLAVKVVIGGSAEDAVRFMREAEIAATLRHENLVSVIDVGMRYGSPYFVMDRLEGGSLADREKRFGDRAFVLPILLQIARGLAVLHEKGILHRDLKPANVLLDNKGDHPTAKIADFGIAHRVVEQALSATVEVAGPTSGIEVTGTSPASVAGTLLYMAPELARGAEATSRASDIFAFGVLAWEICLGRFPYATAAVMTALSGHEIPPAILDTTEDKLAELLVQCVAVDPEARPHVDAIIEALAEMDATFRSTATPALAAP